MTQHRFSMAAVSVAAILAFPLGAVAQSPFQPLPVTVAYPRDHPPVIIEGDAGWAAHPEFPGHGTASDPYVIEGWLFEVPAAPLLGVAPDLRFAGVGIGNAAIQLYGTNASVVIRHNLFAAAGASVWFAQATHSISLYPANHVRIEANEFNMSGASATTILARGNDIVITGNTFSPDTFLDLRGALTVENNVGGGAFLALRSGSRVNANTFESVSVQADLPDATASISNNDITFLQGDWRTGDLLLSANRLGGNGSWCYASINTSHTRLFANHFSCSPSLTTDSAIPLENGNTYAGYPLVQVANLRDAIVDLAKRPLGWFQAGWSTNLTLRGVNVVLPSHWERSNDLDGVTFEDSTLSTGWFYRSANLTFRNVTADRLWVEASGDIVVDKGHASSLSLRNEWYGATHILVRDSVLGTAEIKGDLVTVERVVFNGTPAHTWDQSLVVVAKDASVSGCSFVPGAIGLSAYGSVDARQNWWGAASGPRASGNPNGTGAAIEWDATRSQVLYDPWLTSAP